MYKSTVIPDDTCYTGHPTSYIGNKRVTVSGKTCQAWHSQTPNSHTLGDQSTDFTDGEFPDNSCRTPLDDYSSANPWCYTTDRDTRWESCGVLPCAGNSAEGAGASINGETRCVVLVFKTLVTFFFVGSDDKFMWILREKASNQISFHFVFLYILKNILCTG